MGPAKRTSTTERRPRRPGLLGLALALLGALATWSLVGLSEALGLLVVIGCLAMMVLLARTRALERENRMLHQAIDTAQDPKAILDRHRAITLVNQAFRRTFPAVESGTMTFSRFALMTFEPEGLAPMAAAVETGSAWRGRVTERRSPDRASRSFDLVTTVASEEEGASATLVTLRDVSETVRDERLRRLADEGERAKSETAQAMGLEASLEDRCSASLAAVCQMEGLETLCKGAVLVRSAKDDAVELLSYIGEFTKSFAAGAHVGSGPVCTEVLREGRPVVIDACGHDASVQGCDPSHPHGHYVIPLLERPGQALGALLLFTAERPLRDAPRLEALTSIAEVFAQAILRDRTARLLRESFRRAEEATQAKSDFLATMSHEIRTPMNGVLGFTQLLLESNLADDQREHAQLIYNSAEALLSLLNDILDFSKIEAGKLVIDPRPTAIVDASREAIGLLRATAAKKGVELRFSASDAVPRGVLIDAMRFRQVLLNLTGNAVKFTPSGTVEVSLEVEVEGAARRLLVEVKDSGIGISSSVLPNLFGKFVQADTSTSRRFGGSGLGLAISKRLVELMGGSIGATSTEGVGSTFWFRLPLVDAVVEGGRDRSSKAAAAMAHRRVLLAEDNPINQTLARKVLEKMSAEVVVAANGRIALELAQRERFDLVLMDCQMPELDGYDATRALRRWEAEQARGRLPVIAVTANAFAEDARRCLDAGMDAVLTKPFKLADLERTLLELKPSEVSAEAPASRTG